MSNLALAFAAGLMDSERVAKFKADYQAGLNLAVNAADPAPMLPDAMPVTTPDAYAKFPIGTPVRDFLSGIEGIVAAPPEGEFGDVVFITGNEDGKTYAVRFDQVKAVDGAPGTAVLPPPMPEMPGEPAPEVPGAEGMAPTIPAIEPASLKAGNSTKYREHLKAKNELFRAAASVNDKTLVVAATDDRKLTFAQLKANLNALAAPTAKDALAFIGYVPNHFDTIWAALVRDGVKVTAENAVFHVEQMIAKGLTASEIKFMVCSSNGGVLGKLIAGMPPTAKPTEPAPAGMTYVWDSKMGEWTTVAASLATKAEGDSSLGQPVKVPGYDPKSPASGVPSYPVEKNKDEGKTGGGKDSEGAVVKVSTSDGKSPASGAPKYPVLDPDKAGGMKAADNNSAGKPINVKTYDEQAKASGAPKYPVSDPAAGGGDAPRDQSAEDTLGKTIEVATYDHQTPASGAPAYPVLDPDQAGGQATPGSGPKPQMTPNATAPTAVPAPTDAPASPSPAPAPQPKSEEPKPAESVPAPAPKPAEPKADEPKDEGKKEEAPKKSDEPKAEKKEEKPEDADKK